MNSQIVTTDCFKLGQLTAQKYKSNCFKREQLIEKLTQDITIQNLENKFDAVSKKQLEVIMMLLTESAEVSRQLTMVAVNENMKTTMNITNTITAGNHEMARLINDSTNSLTDAMEKNSFESIKAFWISSYENQKQNLEIFRSTQTIAKEEANLLQELFVKKADEQIERYNKLSEYLDQQVAKMMDDLGKIDQNIAKINEELEQIIEKFESTNEQVQDQLSEITSTASEQQQLLMGTRAALQITNTAGLGPTVTGAPGGALSVNALWLGYGIVRAGRIIRQGRQGKIRAIFGEAFSDVAGHVAGRGLDALGNSSAGQYIGSHVGAAADTLSGGLSTAVRGAVSAETFRAGLGVIGTAIVDEAKNTGLQAAYEQVDGFAAKLEADGVRLPETAAKILDRAVKKAEKKEQAIFEATKTDKFGLGGSSAVKSRHKAL